MELLTFEQLPRAITMLRKDINDLKELLVQKRKEEEKSEKDIFFNIQQAADLLNLSVPTIYSKVSKGELPVMKRGKRLYFSQIELLDYIREGKRRSSTEIVAETEAYFSNKKNKR